jgi:two-component system, OmpR family, phosphate regulon sensor histidine kinase PhoR
VNDTLARILLAIAAFLFAALVMGMFAGSARGVVLCTVGLLCLAACRVKLAPAVPLDEIVPSDSPPPARRSIWRRTLDRLTGSPDARAARNAPAPGAPFGVCVLDEQFRVLWCNGSAGGHFGIRPSATIGLPVARVIFAEEFDSYLTGRNFTRPLKLERAGGTILSLSLVPHLHSQWLLLSRDVTLETRTEVLRRDGVADALHELCTPVTVLAGHVDSLRRTRPEAWRAHDYLGFMEQQCRRMQATIGDLVRLWTLDTAPPPPVEERVDVPALLEQIRADIASLSGGRHHIALDAQPDIGLYGSAAEIASAFGNLASNAVRYTPPGGAVWIVWRRTSEGAELTVEDNGIGIAKEHVPRLTERFYQVDRARSRAAGGSGLGLAIVKGILDRYRASLEIDSEPGRGSRFIARFPAGRVLIMTAPTPVSLDVWQSGEIETGAADVEVALPSPARIRVPDIGGKAPAPL